MALSIQTNLPAQFASRSMGNAQRELLTAVQRLSSGLRINSAKDDAAGLAISDRMLSNLRSKETVVRGISDGISLAQVAEGALGTTTALLQRANELAIQAANAPLSNSDRASLNTELVQIKAEINRIAQGTRIFDIFPLAARPAAPLPEPEDFGDTKSVKDLFAASGTTLTSQISGVKPIGFIPAGAKNVTIAVDGLPGAEDDIQLFTRGGTHVLGTPVLGADADYVWGTNGILSAADLDATLLTTENGFSTDASFDGSAPLIHYADTAGKTYSQDPDQGLTRTYNGMTLKYTGDGDRFPSDTDASDGSTDAYHGIETVNIDEVTEPLFLAVVGTGIYNITLTWDAMPDAGAPTNNGTPAAQRGALEIVTQATPGEAVDIVTIDYTPATTQALGIDTIDISTQEGAVATIAALQSALQTVSGYRSGYGAVTTRFEAVTNYTRQSYTDLSAARSRITDADYAETTVALARSQIIQQAASAMLAQANSTPQLVLSLL